MSDRGDAYEDAWLDWLPYLLSLIIGLIATGMSIGSMLFGCLIMSVTHTWASGTNGWYAAAFVLGILFTIAFCGGWTVGLPVFFEEYKKWRKAKRRYNDTKETV